MMRICGSSTVLVSIVGSNYTAREGCTSWYCKTSTRAKGLNIIEGSYSFFVLFYSGIYQIIFIFVIILYSKTEFPHSKISEPPYLSTSLLMFGIFWILNCLLISKTVWTVAEPINILLYSASIKSSIEVFMYSNKSSCVNVLIRLNADYLTVFCVDFRFCNLPFLFPSTISLSSSRFWYRCFDAQTLVLWSGTLFICIICPMYSSYGFVTISSQVCHFFLYLQPVFHLSSLWSFFH